MGTGKKKMKNRDKGKNNSKSDNSPQSHDKVIDDPQFSLINRFLSKQPFWSLNVCGTVTVVLKCI
ncbi:hypothetical protein MTR_7g102850 [Medicago truncatula]|uniref:Uncharacterized protein n=1 Tax=Medicago truncatula TaxID=3880 RepID=A0A072U4H9_MEDTR|nr:hypothetical protein MTR_7g102850 [Medicago truncatula]